VPAKIHDVAREAGVSITTVSHALNGKGRVSEQTHSRVLEAADRLGYAANQHARGLVTGRAMTLAVQIAGFGPQTFVPESAYFTELLNGACSQAVELGYVAVLVPSAPGADLRRLRADGALVVDPTGDEELIERLRDIGAPVVTTGRVPTDGEQADCAWVDNDHSSAAREALNHLSDRGYDRPALLTTAPESYSLDAQRAYDAWTGERSQDRLVGIIEGEFDADRAAAVTTTLLEGSPAPDAVYATNDTGALGALRAIRAAGLRAPDDIGIVAEMDTEALRLSDPPISAIDVHPVRLGREAVRLLVALIANEEVESNQITIGTELIARASSRGPNGTSTGS
jgi:DNA-binding LacI/PurR family transcriptional regulator